MRKKKQLSKHIYRKKVNNSVTIIRSDRKIIDPLFRTASKKRIFLYEKELFNTVVIDQYSDLFYFLCHNANIAVILTYMLVLNVCFFLTTSYNNTQVSDLKSNLQ